MRGGGYLGIPVSRCHYLRVVINSNLLQVYPTKYNALFNVNGIRLFGTRINVKTNRIKMTFLRYVGLGGFILDSTCSTHNSHSLFLFVPHNSVLWNSQAYSFNGRVYEYDRVVNEIVVENCIVGILLRRPIMSCFDQDAEGLLYHW